MNESTRAPSPRWFWLLFTAALIALLAWATGPEIATQAASAPKATSTPRPPRGVGFANRRSTRAPSVLLVIRRMFAAGGCAPGMTCEGARLAETLVLPDLDRADEPGKLPRLAIVDETDTRTSITAPGQPLKVYYIGFTPNYTVEVGLYREDEGEQPLLDTWQFTTDERGEYVEQIEVPEDAPAGRYIWAACQLGSSPHDSAVGQRLEVVSRNRFDLEWLPARTPAYSRMALLRPGQSPRDPAVEKYDILQLTAALRELSLLTAGERLVVVPLNRPYQGIQVRTATGARVGWIRIGPRPASAGPGGVRRIAFAAPERQVGPQCWLQTDYTWACE